MRISGFACHREIHVVTVQRYHNWEHRLDFFVVVVTYSYKFSTQLTFVTDRKDATWSTFETISFWSIAFVQTIENNLTKGFIYSTCSMGFSSFHWDVTVFSTGFFLSVPNATSPQIISLEIQMWHSLCLPREFFYIPLYFVVVDLLIFRSTKTQV